MASSMRPEQAWPQSACADPAWCSLSREAKEMMWVRVSVAPNLLKIGAEHIQIPGVYAD